ncbi:MAG: hypothetical protein WB507_11895 [Solirubrobacterales bacterium]
MAVGSAIGAVPVICLIAMSHAPSLAAAARKQSAATVSAKTSSTAHPHGYTLLLAGGTGPTEINISLGADGRTYVISANGPLEVGIQACANPADNQNELICQAPAVGAFEINGGNDGDKETVGKSVPVPAILRGGSGNDVLIGGSDDTLFGRAGEDTLIGRGRNDRLYGGPGNDRLLAEGSGDLLNGGPGYDTCIDGSSHGIFISCDVVRRGVGRQFISP